MINDDLQSTLDRGNITRKHDRRESSHNDSTEETMEARLAKFGNERPQALQSLWQENLFVYSIIMSQFLAEYFVSGFAVLAPTLSATLALEGSQQVWPVVAFSLATASTLLFFGRLGDRLDGFVVYSGGLAWLAVWSLIVGFSGDGTVFLNTISQIMLET